MQRKEEAQKSLLRIQSEYDQLVDHVGIINRKN